jgi:hypothetical protein
MKKIILAFGLLTSTAIAFAGINSNQTNVSEKNISATIRSQIQFPEFLKEKDGEHTAAIFFKVSPHGNIKIERIECTDEDLRSNLMEQAENFKVNTSGLDTRDTYKVVVRFNTL